MRLDGASEVAGELGVPRQRLRVLRERPEFPDPIGTLAQGPVWDLDAVRAGRTPDCGRRLEAVRQAMLPRESWAASYSQNLWIGHLIEDVAYLPP